MKFHHSVYKTLLIALFAIFILSTTAVQVRLASAKSIETDTTSKFLLLSESINLVNINEFQEFILDGANIDALNRYGATALHMAAESGNKEVVSLLIDVKANVNKSTKAEQVTPLYIASQNGYGTIVKLLLDSGADTRLARRVDGLTPLWIASQEGHFDVVKHLLKAGADVSVTRNIDGADALYMAAQNGYPSVVKLLIDAGAETNRAVSTYGVTPLYIASQNGHVDSVGLLSKAGADANIVRSMDNVSPLWIASQEGHLDVVELLLSLKDGLKEERLAQKTEPKENDIAAKTAKNAQKAKNDSRTLIEDMKYDGPADALLLLLEGQQELEQRAVREKKRELEEVAVEVDA
ncbi:MAG: ankyrin repeat domain-containing protein, partial [Proteobacteria bacterium]|nr:ankyrin repeat domain-containing protein [Pseudomonadota bacterium]